MNQHTKRESRFHALDVALEIIRELAPIVERIRRRDTGLAKQIKEAGSSLPLNVAEASRRKGGDRRYHFTVAAGSADEVRVALLAAEAWGYIAMCELGSVLTLLDRELAMLSRLSR
jgi:four helix bundle protein